MTSLSATSRLKKITGMPAVWAAFTMSCAGALVAVSTMLTISRSEPAVMAVLTWSVWVGWLPAASQLLGSMPMAFSCSSMAARTVEMYTSEKS